MSKVFNLNVKIVDDNGETKIKTDMGGTISAATAIAVFAEIIPEILQNNRVAIMMLSCILAEGRSPSKDGYGTMYRIDCSRLKGGK